MEPTCLDLHRSKPAQCYKPAVMLRGLSCLTPAAPPIEYLVAGGLRIDSLSGMLQTRTDCRAGQTSWAPAWLLGKPHPAQRAPQLQRAVLWRQRRVPKCQLPWFQVQHSEWAVKWASRRNQSAKHWRWNLNAGEQRRILEGSMRASCICPQPSPRTRAPGAISQRPQRSEKRR